MKEPNVYYCPDCKTVMQNDELHFWDWLYKSLVDVVSAIIIGLFLCFGLLVVMGVTWKYAVNSKFAPAAFCAGFNSSSTNQ